MPQPLPTWQVRLQTELELWRGTPWVAGQQCRGRGVDCVRFVVAVLDPLHRAESLAELPRLPQDMAWHDREGAFRTALAIERRYPHTIIDPRPELIEPGDVAIMRAGAKGGPGHALIAGVGGAGELWHSCFGVGVVTTSARSMAANGGAIVRIWRPLEREKW
jgi:cell wall-associated NlpC family hydrolase